MRGRSVVFQTVWITGWLFEEGANNGLFEIVWKDSRNKRFVYDISDVRKKSVKAITQQGDRQRAKGSRANFTITFLTG